MLKLLSKIVLLAFLMAFILSLALLWPRPLFSKNYDAAILDKQARLHNTPSPRIIFVGGCNIALGLDSALVEKNMGMPVVNMGLYGGLGLQYMLTEVMAQVRQGDIVVIIPEYDQFYGDYFYGTSVLATMYISFPSIRPFVTSPRQYLTIIKNYPQALRFCLYTLINGLFAQEKDSVVLKFNRDAFNAQGDLVGYLDLPAPQEADQGAYEEIKGNFNTEVIPALNQFNTEAGKKGARVFFSYPSYNDLAYAPNKNKFALLRQQLKKELHTPVLSEPSNYVFPSSFFYRSEYHLFSEGKYIRTLRMISDLNRRLRP